MKALRASTASLRSRPKTKLSAVLVAEELYLDFQSAAFTAQCLSTLQLVKNAASICNVDGCWCRSQARVGSLNASSLAHAVASIDDGDLANVVFVAQLSKFPEYKPFIQELKLERYTDSGLLVEFHGSSYCRAYHCYLCADTIVGKAHSTQGVSFCAQCWSDSHSRSQSALDCHVKHWHYQPAGC